MPRYKIIVEYDGTHLAGWQCQSDAYSVQEALETAIKNLSGQQVRVTASGRTDAGVHALGQAAHFDIEKDFPQRNIVDGLNFFLRKDERLPIPHQVAVIASEQVDFDFNARFSAKKRYYRYIITNRRGHLALDGLRKWCIHEPLDAAKMHAAAQLLVGVHDFTSFRSTECQSKSPIKSLDELNVERQGDEVIITTSAKSFLHHQVRNMVGSLRLIGNGKWQESDLLAALAARDRRAAGETAPAHGLYFVKVEY
jgi:tRNA pseudouridine38-40 synthase